MVAEYFSKDIFKNMDIVDWGYTEESIPKSFSYYKDWLKDGKEGILNYLSDHRSNLRSDLKNYFPDFQSSLVFLFSYKKTRSQLESFYKKDRYFNGNKIASYVLGYKGFDYHFILRDYLLELSEIVKKSYGEMTVKISLDTQPILERDLAYRAGLGWFGKNSMLISQKEGSFFLIGALLLDKKLPLPIKLIESDHCGTCTACIDKCPTDAIDPMSRTLNANRCISTFTIEQFKDDEAPIGYQGGSEIFGCDICQDVCPWNRETFSFANDSLYEKGTEKQIELINFFKCRENDKITFELKNMSKKGFKRKFKDTSLERTGRDGLLKNINRKV